MSGHGNDHADDGQEKKSGAGKGWILMIFFGLLGILLIKFLLSSNNGDTRDNNDKKESQKEQSNQSYKRIKHVTYGPELGDEIKLPTGFDYYFEGATQPYCYFNANGMKACGEAGEDATGTMGNGSANKKLRFQSQNNEKGELDIILIKR